LITTKKRHILSQNKSERISPIQNHPGQLQIWKSKKRFNVTVAGRRFGKTTLGKEKLAKYSQVRRGLFWYIGPTRGQAKDLMWEELKDTFRYYGWKFSKNEQDLTLTRTLTQCRIAVKSADKEDRLRGKGLNGVILDEFQDMKKKVWTECVRPALSDKRGWADFIGTPKGFNHFYDLYQAARKNSDWGAFSFKTIDSPLFQTPEGRAEIEAAKRDLDERTFRQEYEASFETFSGRICYAFDRVIHHSPITYDPNLAIIVGQDFNRNPMAGVLFQKVGGRLIAIDEMVINTSSTDEICRIIKEKYPNWIRHGVIFHPDATGSRRTSNSSKSDHQIIKDHGFIVQVGTKNPNRVDRWASCNRSLEKDQVLINTERCPKLVNELEKLSYKEGTCEPDISNKEGQQGHVFDGFGYAVFYHFPVVKPGKARVQYY
jgi:hypothetical protein